MRTLSATILIFALTPELHAQYGGRRGVRYMNHGTVSTVRLTGGLGSQREARCTIRVRIDDISDVELRGNQLRVRPIRGGPGRDEGSECTAPLPTSGYISNFRFRGIDGRGNPRLVQMPDSRNYYVAVVNVEDPAGGDEGYTFELSWNWDGSGGGGYYPKPTRPSPPTGGGIFPEDGQGSLPDVNTSMRGYGTLDDGYQRYNLTDMRLRVRGSSCELTLTTDRGRRLEMRGRTSPQTSRCLIDYSNLGRTSGNAYIRMNGNSIDRMNVSGNINGRNFTADFQR